MNNFTFYTPTKIVFGKGAENSTGELTASFGGKKALVHYGGGSAVRSGLLIRVIDSLKKAGVKSVALGGVVPNPRLSKVYEGIELCRKEGVDFVIAVGGGSVIDSSKAIALGTVNEGDVWDFYIGKREAQRMLPVGAVLTMAAAGSEMSDSSVITKEEGALKRFYGHEMMRCKFSVLNPELTMTLPDYQTASGCVDILTHTMERYFCDGDSMQLTDGIAESLMRTVIHNARVLSKTPNDYNARAEIMWASSLSHNDLTGCGSGASDWATHMLEHELGGAFDVAHGAGLAALWGSWARYVCGKNISRFARFGANVMGVTGANEQETAVNGIKAVENFYREINMPTSIKELGLELTDEQISALAYKCSDGDSHTVGSFMKLTRIDMENIYKAAR